MKRRLYPEPIGPWPLPIGPVRPITFVPLLRKDDAEAIAIAHSLLNRNERVVFDCDWSGDRGIASLGFEVTHERGRFVVWIGHGYASDHATLEEAVRLTFLTGGCLE